MTTNIKPIVKWAGGKSKIFSHFKTKYNTLNPDRFFDLFCGSLSLPLCLTPQNAVFNDINIWLINLYKVVKKYLPLLKKQLNELNKEKYNSSEEFYTIRSKYNTMKHKDKLSKKELIEMAAIFIYLNKRSFNGLYRENLSGDYNVPYRKNNTSIYCEEDLDNLSKYFNDNNIILNQNHMMNLK